MRYFETLQTHKIADKRTSLRERARIAYASMPENLAHMQLVAREADMSEKRLFASDEMIHGFARSRISDYNPVQRWNAELFARPVHQQTGMWAHQPTDRKYNGQDQRYAAYADMAPAPKGRNDNRTYY